MSRSSFKRASALSDCGPSPSGVHDAVLIFGCGFTVQSEFSGLLSLSEMRMQKHLRKFQLKQILAISSSFLVLSNKC